MTFSFCIPVPEIMKGFPTGSSGKEPICQCRRLERCGFDPWVGKIPWRRKWQPAPVFLLGKSHGQRSLGATVHGVTKESEMQYLGKISKNDRMILVYFQGKPFNISIIKSILQPLILKKLKTNNTF